jgi:hypothetical protein
VGIDDDQPEREEINTLKTEKPKGEKPNKDTNTSLKGILPNEKKKNSKMGKRS